MIDRESSWMAFGVGCEAWKIYFGELNLWLRAHEKAVVGKKKIWTPVPMHYRTVSTRLTTSVQPLTAMLLVN